MTLHTQENMRHVLNRLAEGAKLTHAMRGIAHCNMIFNWINRDDLWVEDFPTEGCEPVLFREGVQIAKAMCLAAWDLQIRNEVRDGIPRMAMTDKGPVWLEDERIILELGPNPDPELIYLYFGQRDTFLRQPNPETGELERVPRIVMDPCPAHLKIHALKSLMPDTFNPIDHRQIDANISEVSVSHLIVGNKPVAKQENEMSHSELVADLKQRLAELEAHGPKNPRPERPVFVGKPEDEPPEKQKRPSNIHGAPMVALPPPTREDRGEQDHIGRGGPDPSENAFKVR
jgi:hypothetical protein